MSTDNRVASEIVRRAALPPEGQRAALNTAGLRSLLLDSPRTALTDDVWVELYGTTRLAPARIAKQLAAGPLSAAQLEHLLSVETRPTVLAAAVERTRVAPGPLSRLLDSPKAGRQVAKALCKAQRREPGWVPDPLRATVARLAGGHDLLAALCDDTFDDTHLTDLLAQFDTWGPSGSRRTKETLAALFERRPSTLESAAASGNLTLISALAGSRLLRGRHDLQRVVSGLDANSPTAHPEELRDDDRTTVRYMWLAFVNNPVATRPHIEHVAAADVAGFEEVHRSAAERLARTDRPTVTDAYHEVADPAVLRWLVNRSLPGVTWDGRPRPGRPFDLLDLAGNEHLGTLAERVLDGLYTWEVATYLAEFADPDPVIAALVDRYGLDTQGRPPLTDWATPAPPAGPHGPVEPAAGDVRLSRVLSSHLGDAVAAALVAGLDGEGHWAVAFGLADEQQDLAVAEFIEMVRLLA